MSVTLSFIITLVSDFQSIIRIMSLYINMSVGNSDVEGLGNDLSQHNRELEREKGKEH